MSVPTIYLNGEVFGAGRMELDEILLKIDTGAVSYTHLDVYKRQADDSGNFIVYLKFDGNFG